MYGVHNRVLRYIHTMYVQDRVVRVYILCAYAKIDSDVRSYVWLWCMLAWTYIYISYTECLANVIELHVAKSQRARGWLRALVGP